MSRVLITGASGMIGGIVLEQSLQSEQVTEVISLTRKKSGVEHPKLKEVIHADFLNYKVIESSFKNIDAAYFCIGVYTGAVPDAEFKKITVDYTVAFANALKSNSPNSTLCFLSGEGADRTEKSKLSFARYKGMAENYLISKNFQQLYIFRPSYIYPVAKRVEPNLAYRIFRSLYPVIKLFGKNTSIKSTELGEAMFKAGLHGAGKTTLENADILHIIQ